MKKLKITPSKLNLYKEKISTLSDDQKSLIVGGDGAVNPGLEFLSIFDCKTKTDNCPTNSTLQPTTSPGNGSRNVDQCWSYDLAKTCN